MTRRAVKRTLLVFGILILLAGLAVGVALHVLDVPPRALGPYIERRATGHNPAIEMTGKLISQTLIRLDRGEPAMALPDNLRIGAHAQVRPFPAVSPNPILVSSSDEAVRAIANARPGDAITFLPGTYRLGRRSLRVSQPGMEHKRILLRAERLNTVFLEVEVPEGFVVSAPYWVFENLNITGVCQVHSVCEHAVHVVGKARHFVARNNLITDFNAHFKINGFNGDFPDDGRLENNTLTNSSIRRTPNPVTPIDLVGASNWVISQNMITDFIKGDGNGVSYGAFVKGGGSLNRLERNIILCESRLPPAPGQRVGLSLGGGGTGKEFCRDRQCITEQEKSVIQSNLIMHCSDDGIYVNRSAQSQILHNTLIDTGGILVRFPESSADVQGNLVDGALHVRNDGLLRAQGNEVTSTLSLYFGRHPVKALFDDSGSLAWKDTPPLGDPVQSSTPDLCASQRTLPAVLGAFDDFAACRY